jgi:hypothetical protein
VAEVRRVQIGRGHGQRPEEVVVGGGSESVGHDSGEKIVTILGKKKSDLTDDDLAHMRKVAGYVKRHRAQPPKQEKIEDSRWRYSLMNWGHDPLKK